MVIKNSVEQNIVESWVRDASLPGYEFRIELSWQFQNYGKKGIGLCEEDVMCDLKLQ
jgi:hypothetical protein